MASTKKLCLITLCVCFLLLVGLLWTRYAIDDDETPTDWWPREFRLPSVSTIPVADAEVAKIQPNTSCSPTSRYVTTPCGCLRPHQSQSPLMASNTTCSLFAAQRGPGQRVVSFSFYGSRTHKRGYFQGIEGNAMMMPQFYPGWVMRVYHDTSREDNEAKQMLCTLECKFPFLDLCQISEIPRYGNLDAWTESAWRYLPMGDPQVDYFVSRDLDSRFTKREVSAVIEWMELGKTWHIMRDHPHHYGIPILSGMWGVNLQKKRDAVRNLLEDLIRLPTKHNFGRDQDILKMVIWPHVLGDSIRHEAYHCDEEPTKDFKPWPTPRLRRPYNFVGAPQTLNKSPLLTPCPAQCRPKHHQNWIWC